LWGGISWLNTCQHLVKTLKTTGFGHFLHHPTIFGYPNIEPNPDTDANKNWNWMVEGLKNQ
jgi:hypothetical protein